MRGDEKCPFSGVTNYGRVWRKDVGKRGVEMECVECVESSARVSLACPRSRIQGTRDYGD